MEQGGFFDAQITDQFVNNLDDLTYSELITILRDHFNAEYHQLSKISQGNQHLVRQISSGEQNIAKLEKIRDEHTKQKLKIGSQLQLIQMECQRLKNQIMQTDK